jgi:hypothetical protein bfra3_11891|nr:MAG TPA: tail collar fiber protein [Caudoviricetes sp.]
MGIVIGIGQTKPQVPYETFYGVEWDVTVANPDVQRVGKKELHALLPVQSLMRRCVLRDNGEVAYYLDTNDSTKKEGGAPAKLDGTDGQVMVEMPSFYYKFEEDGNKRRALISLENTPGFSKFEKCYVSAYEATVQHSSRKMASVATTNNDYRGGDGSLIGKNDPALKPGYPISNISAVTALEFARARGARWNFYLYEAHKMLFWLFVIEYATFEAKKDFVAGVDSNGYKRGGIGQSVCNSNVGGVIIPCGVTNRLGNSTGVVSYTNNIPSGGSEVLSVPSYRGVELPFGHLYMVVNGVFFDNDWNVIVAKTADVVASDTLLRSGATVGSLPRRSGYIKGIAFGAGGDIIASEVGGSSRSYFCDYSYSSGERPAFGSHSNEGAGFAGFLYSRPVGTVPMPNVGTRLCYYPQPK